MDIERTYTASDFRRYKALIEERLRLSSALKDVEREISIFESSSGSVGNSVIPARLLKTYSALKKLGGRAKLDAIYKARGGLSRAGVRAQLMKLKDDYNAVRQTETWGEFEITV